MRHLPFSSTFFRFIIKIRGVNWGNSLEIGQAGANHMGPFSQGTRNSALRHMPALNNFVNFII